MIIVKPTTVMPPFMGVATVFMSDIAWKQYDATKKPSSAVLMETVNLTLVMVILHDQN